MTHPKKEEIQEWLDSMYRVYFDIQYGAPTREHHVFCLNKDAHERIEALNIQNFNFFQCRDVKGLGSYYYLLSGNFCDFIDTHLLSPLAGFSEEDLESLKEISSKATAAIDADPELQNRTLPGVELRTPKCRQTTEAIGEQATPPAAEKGQ